MPVYKFTFANNAVLSCTEYPGKTMERDSYYEHHNGYLIYAFVQAQDEKQARAVADGIVDGYLAGNAEQEPA